MEKENKYVIISNKTCAMALNYCGFSYYKYNDRENPNVLMYSFEDSESFQEALHTLNSLRKMNNKYKK